MKTLEGVEIPPFGFMGLKSGDIPLVGEVMEASGYNPEQTQLDRIEDKLDEILDWIDENKPLLERAKQLADSPMGKMATRLRGGRER